ncbi:unnamed protein product [Litomosoides sigmodontis]|uniref:Uncharacterized protein n=1 Tax=Litomosoides sigmodontis TaxID=42156 RepID=A0A3P6TE58_LITSI|nr:unnamed protein product [Litomosoides sigmodontis]
MLTSTVIKYLLTVVVITVLSITETDAQMSVANSFNRNIAGRESLNNNANIRSAGGGAAGGGAAGGGAAGGGGDGGFLQALLNLSAGPGQAPQQQQIDQNLASGFVLGSVLSRGLASPYTYGFYPYYSYYPYYYYSYPYYFRG